jgi:uncharacterized membrane protein
MKKEVLIIGLIAVIVVIAGAVYYSQSNKSKPGGTQNQMQPTLDSATTTPVDEAEAYEFTGNKGETVKLVDGKVAIPTTGFEVNRVKFFNSLLPDGTTVYFMVLKDKDGYFRVAANGNKQCAKYGKGYVQEGDKLVCTVCEKSYSVEDFAIEKPDCNPYPINANEKIDGINVVISLSELETVTSLFK